MIPILTNGQWSSNPKENMTIYPGDYPDQRYSTEATNSGDVYIVWSSRSTKVFIQLFDKNGNNIWENNIQIPINHRVERIYIKVDHCNNAVMAFQVREIIDGYYNYRILLRKIDTSGNILWGTEGPDFELADQYINIIPFKIWINRENSVIITYKRHFKQDGIRLQETIIHRIRADGTLYNGNFGIKIGNSEGYVFDLFPVAKDDYIVALGNYIGTHHDDNKYEVFFRRLNRLGEKVWEEDKYVYSGFVDRTASFYSGNNNDFYYILRSARVQRMSIKGNELWEHGGVNIIKDSTANANYSKIAGISPTGKILLLFTRTNIGFPMLRNYYCQSISLDGDRLIGDKGSLVFPGSAGSSVRYRIKGDSAYLFYFPYQNSSFNDTIRAMGLNFLGEKIWGGTVDISNSNRKKGLPSISQFINDQAVAVWGEVKGNIKGLVMAQNIFTDGTLGISTLGIKENEIKKNYISAYDPRNNSLRFNNLKGNEDLIIFNTLGQIIYNSHISGTIILPDIQQGVYIIKIIRLGKVLETKKMFLK